MNNYLWAFACLCFLACTHEPTIPTNPIKSCVTEYELILRDSCSPVPRSNNPIGYFKVFSDSLPSAPVYSLNNENELFFRMQIAREIIGGGGSRLEPELWKMDICTDEKMFLMGEIIGTPSINMANWLIVNRSDRQIWAVKTNGDSLTQLTFDGINYEANWLPNQKCFSYFHKSGNRQKLLMMDFATRQVDTISYFTDWTTNFSWSPYQDSVIVEYFNSNIITLKLLDLNTLIEETLSSEVYSPQTVNNFSFIRWSKDLEHIYWMQSFNFYEFSLLTKEVRKLTDGCAGDLLLGITLSPAGDYLFANWNKDSILQKDDTLFQTSSLVRMDLKDPKHLEELQIVW